MNSACPRWVSLITAGGLPAIPSPTIGAMSGVLPAASGFCPPRQASSFARRLAHPRRPNRVHGGCPLGILCYGLVVLVPLLSTSHCCGAVTVRFRTAFAAQRRTSTTLSPRLLRRTSARASRAVFRALAENLERARKFRRFAPASRAKSWTRGASSHTRGGCAPQLRSSGLIPGD